MESLGSVSFLGILLFAHGTILQGDDGMRTETRRFIATSTTQTIQTVHNNTPEESPRRK
jgi:hypothetical protein